jgi:hypothetical protein
MWRIRAAGQRAWVAVVECVSNSARVATRMLCVGLAHRHAWPTLGSQRRVLGSFEILRALGRPRWRPINSHLPIIVSSSTESRNRFFLSSSTESSRVKKIQITLSPLLMSLKAVRHCASCNRSHRLRRRTSRDRSHRLPSISKRCVGACLRF